MQDEHDVVCEELDVHRYVDNNGWVTPYCSICGKISQPGEIDLDDE